MSHVPNSSSLVLLKPFGFFEAEIRAYLFISSFHGCGQLFDLIVPVQSK